MGDFTAWNYIVFFSAITFLVICYSIFTDQQAAHRDRDEHTFDFGRMLKNIFEDLF